MRRFRMSTGLVLFAVVVLTCAGIDLLSRNSRFTQFTESRELERFKSGSGLFMNRGAFVDFEDRLLLEEIPSTDFARGGAFFFGTSSMKWGLKTWEMDPATRALVHNFGMGATNHRFVAQFIRYLVEHEGMLRAGSSNVHVVLGCYWTMITDWGETGYFSRLWDRHGLFLHDEIHGIEPADLGVFRRKLRIEQARLSGFVSVNTWRMARYLAASAGIREGQREQVEIRRRAIQWAKWASVPNSERELRTELAALRALLSYLGEKGVGVTIVLLPTSTIYDELPLPQEYRAKLGTVADENQVTFVDLSRLLNDDEYYDLHHANYRGLGKQHEALISLVRPHLERLMAPRR